MRKLGILCAILCAIASLLVFLPERTLASQTPTEAIKATIDNVLSILQQPDYADEQKRPPLRAKIDQEIYTIFDFREFSKRTLGNNWTKFSQNQQQRFVDAFSKLLLATYLDKIDGYNGEQVVYLGERFTQKGKLAEVQTTITLSSGQVVPVAYRMVVRNGTWRVYDVLVENVGLNSNYRAQFRDILSKSGPEDLIGRVENRVTELHKQSETAK